MKKVKYLGDVEVIVMSLNLTVNKGDIIDVPDDFYNGAFEEVPAETKKSKEESKEVTE